MNITMRAFASGKISKRHTTQIFTRYQSLFCLKNKKFKNSDVFNKNFINLLFN